MRRCGGAWAKCKRKTQYIDSWPTTVTSLGARLALNGEWQLYAPFGLEDSK
ncbi:nucleotidyltransferase family protein [Paenibacillus tritici]|uniref:Nucleotidyltransferase family protein n=1 Tax=Paenibacillus tritici TaxID=1873425 RepID=A0ABX2DKW5_9BACL|nr:nucleotidyltransferase family protein [Paenibacillus tritici]